MTAIPYLTDAEAAAAACRGPGQSAPASIRPQLLAHRP